MDGKRLCGVHPSCDWIVAHWMSDMLNDDTIRWLKSKKAVQTCVKELCRLVMEDFDNIYCEYKVDKDGHVTRDVK